MNDHSDDPIIDACLDEVLGGQIPPNLTGRILQAWDDAGALKSRSPSPEVLAVRIEASPAAGSRASLKVAGGGLAGHASRRASPWLAIAASLGLIGIGSGFVWVAWNATESRNHRPAEIAAPESPSRPALAAPVPRAGTMARNPSEPATVSPEPVFDFSPLPDRSFATDIEPGTSATPPISDIDIPDERPAALPDEQIVMAINELIRQDWRREGIEPAQPVTDEQWCERVYLKLIGRAPSPSEVSSFVQSRSAKKRETLVDLLLHGETYVEEFASHWSRTWSEILLTSGDRGKSHSAGLEQYLRRAFGEGKPFDETTSELLTATGSSAIGAADYNGATNFLVAYTDREGVYAEATAHVSRTFMALSLECSQCHVDSTWSGMEQQKFWELNAFFRQLDLKRDPQRGWVVSDIDIRPRGSRSTDGETYYSLLDGTMRAAYPVFVDGTEIPRTPNVEQVNRRALLAKLVTRSEQFRQAMANRFWAEMFGVGFTIPADNIGPHNPPSHPELLAKLGAQFAAHNYDVRELIRWIALSEPFALSSGDVARHDQIGAKLAFDRFPQEQDVRVPVLKRLRIAQEAYASITKVPGLAGTSARVNPTTVPGAVPVELSEVDKLLATVSGDARRLSRSTVYGSNILDSAMSLELKIQHLFFATLHRAPTPSEQKAVEELLASGDAAANSTALEYVWWALASSQEAR